MGVCPHRGEGCAGFLFYEWERIARFAGIRKTRGLEAETGSGLRASFQIADGMSRNMKTTRLDRRSAVEPVRRTSSAALRRRFRRAFGVVACLCGGICLFILARIKKCNGFLGFVSRETIPIPHSVLQPPCGKTAVRPPHVPFRPHAVSLTHRCGRAHQRSCAVSEESSHWIYKP